MLPLRLFLLYSIFAKRQLIHDRTASRNSWDESYHFIIVGAGTAGCTIAHRLTENPNVKVLLLEAGGAQSAIYNDIPALNTRITEERPDLQWLYYNEPQVNSGKQYPNGIIPDYMGKTVGGSSTHNNMIFNRGNHRDYDYWEDMYGAKGWRFRDILPFFKKFENNTDLKIVHKNPEYHGTNGRIQVKSEHNLPKMIQILRKTFNELGFETTDFNGENQLGTMIMQLTIDSNGFRSSNGNAYVDPNPHPYNLHILTKAYVVKILFNGVTAVGVQFVYKDKTFRVFARNEVILTAGPFNSPQLLMLSGIGPKDHLKEMGIPVLSDLPVGNNHKNHPFISVGSKILDPSLFYPLPKLDINSLSELYYQKSGRLMENPTNGLYFNSDGNNTNDWPNSLLYTDVSNDTLSLINFLARVRSRGTVRLKSLNPFTPPRIDPGLLSDPLDFIDFVEGVRFSFYILEMSSIAQHIRLPSFDDIDCPVCPNKHKYECNDFIECYVRFYTSTGSHSCCGCHMGAEHRTDVVVDPFLRVKNVFNLRVCDSSIFPELPNGNLNSPTTMVAEKCSHLIKVSHKLFDY